MSGCLRNGRIWTAHAINDPTLPTVFATVRWYKLNIEKFPRIKLSQLQTLVPTDQDNLWMSHIDVNENNDMALGFSVGGSGRFASIGFTGRSTNDDPNTTRPYVIAKEGVDNYVLLDNIGRNRWGDYSGMSFDPVNDKMFWLFNEFAGAKSSNQRLTMGNKFYCLYYRQML